MPPHSRRKQPEAGALFVLETGGDPPKLVLGATYAGFCFVLPGSAYAPSPAPLSLFPRLSLTRPFWWDGCHLHTDALDFRTVFLILSTLEISLGQCQL